MLDEVSLSLDCHNRRLRVAAVSTKVNVSQQIWYDKSTSPTLGSKVIINENKSKFSLNFRLWTISLYTSLLWKSRGIIFMFWTSSVFSVLEDQTILRKQRKNAHGLTTPSSYVIIISRIRACEKNLLFYCDKKRGANVKWLKLPTVLICCFHKLIKYILGVCVFNEIAEITFISF